MNKNIIAILTLTLILSNFVSASDELLFFCGGDDELVIGCVGDNALNAMGQREFEGYGGDKELPDIEKLDKLGLFENYLIVIIPLILIFLCLFIFIIAKRRRKRDK